MGDRVFAYHNRGHDHYWCSQACFEADCQFGPCCDMPEVRFEPYVEEWDALGD